VRLPLSEDLAVDVSRATGVVAGEDRGELGDAVLVRRPGSAKERLLRLCARVLAEETLAGTFVSGSFPFEDFFLLGVPWKGGEKSVSMDKGVEGREQIAHTSVVTGGVRTTGRAEETLSSVEGKRKEGKKERTHCQMSTRTPSIGSQVLTSMTPTSTNWKR
jgi:hypothetical protein